jgi:hypothetical protein
MYIQKYKIGKLKGTAWQGCRFFIELEIDSPLSSGAGSQSLNPSKP